MDHVPDTTAEAEPEAETAASQSSSAPADPRRAATAARARELLAAPLLDLVHRAATVHREHHDPSRIQCAQLLSIKTGACPEDCGYCSQSARHSTGLAREALMETDEVLQAAQRARDAGADRFCMGAAWREVRCGKDFDRVLDMVRGVKDMGLEVCATLGMVDDANSARLAEAGLDYYNHNLDTSREHYEKVIGTRTYDDRLETLENVRAAGMKVCSGGILGMGETREDRAEFLTELAVLDPPPESVPINALVPVEGTPLEDQEPLPWDEIVRVCAAARILMPRAAVRLSAGRREMTEEAQALCFLAGVNSIFVGDALLTTPNPEPTSDAALLARVGLRPLADGPR
ncbi:MAG: biotin synthase BioB [Planctomycetota bacterium]|jgi:biotin synthase